MINQGHSSRAFVGLKHSIAFLRYSRDNINIRVRFSVCESKGCFLLMGQVETNFLDKDRHSLARNSKNPGMA